MLSLLQVSFKIKLCIVKEKKKITWDILFYIYNIENFCIFITNYTLVNNIDII